MCACTSDTEGSTGKVEHTPDTLVLKVEDMTCGHCARTIAKALETGLPFGNARHRIDRFQIAARIGIGEQRP